MTIDVLLASCIPLGPFAAPATMLVLLVIAQLLLHPRWSEGSYKQQTSMNLLSELSPDSSRCHYRTLSTYKEITTRQVQNTCLVLKSMKQDKICRICIFYEVFHHLHTQSEDQQVGSSSRSSVYADQTLPCHMQPPYKRTIQSYIQNFI